MKVDSKLVKLAFQAVRDPDQWQSLLQHIISSTPAKAAIITLRDKSTCQIVNDDVLENEYHSPLIQGFPVEAVMYYLNELRTIDPWAKAQMTHYPFRPTIMSKVCHPKAAKDRRFFDWLESGNLRDTVAFELDRLPGHWTAMNLFLENHDTDDGKVVREYCEAHHEILKEAWRSSQYVIKCQQSGYACLNHLTARAVPACIVTTNGDVFLANEHFGKLVESGVAKISVESKRLSLCESAQVIGLNEGSKLPVSWHSTNAQEINIIASSFEPDPLYQNKTDCYWLLKFSRMGDTEKAALDDAFQIEILTPQERALLEAIGAGRNIQDAGASVGLQRSRTVRRQGFWDRLQLNLSDILAHRFFDIKRLCCGIANAAV